jgi:hypothetical protein
VPPRPSQSTGDAPRRSPPTIRGVHAAHTARRHAPSPRPRRDPHVHPRRPFCSSMLPHECLTSQCRRDGAHRRSGARRPPHRPPPRTVTAPRLDPPFCSSELPHECLTSQCRPSQSTGDAPRRSPPTIRCAPPHHTARRHAPRPRRPDATPTSTRAALFVPPSCRTNASRANAARAAS